MPLTRTANLRNARKVLQMAVYKSKDPFRVKPWCADVYKGSTRVKRYFASKQEADEEHAKLTLSPISKKGWDNIKVRSLVERYRNEITPTKPGYKTDNPKVDNETYRLNYILNNNPGKLLCGYSLSDLVASVQAWQYVRTRQKQVTMRTISRERNLLQDVFRVAIDEWGYIGLTNPFKGLKLKGSKFKRTRRLKDGELAKLLTACQKCHDDNKYYVPLAIFVALETGMREDEIFNLRWRDVDFDKRTIKIVKSKMDYKQQSPGRTIPIPWNTMFLLGELRLKRTKDVTPNDLVFPKGQGAIIQAFEKVVVRAGIPNKEEDLQSGIPENDAGLEFRDLRREANSTWGEKEPILSDTQRKLMTGHLKSSTDINDTYSVPKLKEIRDKLDRQSYGKTFDEVFNKQLTKWTITEFLKQWIDFGGTSTLLLLAQLPDTDNSRFIEDIANGAFLVDLPDERLHGTPKQTSSGEIYYSFDTKGE